jgi:hypothetical protein
MTRSVTKHVTTAVMDEHCYTARSCRIKQKLAFSVVARDYFNPGNGKTYISKPRRVVMWRKTELLIQQSALLCDRGYSSLTSLITPSLILLFD